MNSINVLNIDGTTYSTSSIKIININGELYAFSSINQIDKEKLIPENIRSGVILFEGTEDEVVGSFWPISTKIAYSGAQTSLRVSEGYYEIEMAGAQGGSGGARYQNFTGGIGGKGGYIKAKIHVTKASTLNIWVGGKGKDGGGGSSSSGGSGGGGGFGYGTGYNGSAGWVASGGRGGGGGGGGGSKISNEDESIYLEASGGGGGGGKDGGVGGKGGGTNGGSAGASSTGGGGGGSSYKSATNVSSTNGFNADNGYIQITQVKS